MFKKLNLRYAIAIVSIFVLCGLFIFASVTRSQARLRDLPLSQAQNTDLLNADKEIGNAENQLRQMYGNRQMLARGFAISLGIKPEEIARFKIEKRPDGRYRFLEYTLEELKKIAEQQPHQGGR